MSSRYASTSSFTDTTSPLSPQSSSAGLSTAPADHQTLATTNRMTEERCCQRQAHPLLVLELGRTRLAEADTSPIGLCGQIRRECGDWPQKKAARDLSRWLFAAVMEQVSFKSEQDDLQSFSYACSCKSSRKSLFRR